MSRRMASDNRAASGASAADVAWTNTGILVAMSLGAGANQAAAPRARSAMHANAPVARVDDSARSELASAARTRRITARLSAAPGSVAHNTASRNPLFTGIGTFAV